MTPNGITCAVISGNRELRQRLAKALRSLGSLVDVAADLERPGSELDGESLASVWAVPHLDLIVADLGDASPAAFRTLQRLSADRPSVPLLAVGPPLAGPGLLQVMRAGVWEYIPTPATETELTAGLDRLVRRRRADEPMDPAEIGRLVTVFSARGGAGVTTAAVNLAVQMRESTGRRTLLVDLDVDFGAVSILTGVKPRYSVLDLLGGVQRLDGPLLRSLVESHESGIDVLSAPADLPPGGAAPERGVTEAVLDFLRQSYEVVIVDAGRPLSGAARVAVEQADCMLMLVTPDVAALRNTARLLGALGLTGRPRTRPVVLLSKAGDSDDVTAREVSRALNMEVSQRLRRDDVAVQHALNHGRPVVMSGGRSVYVRDIRSLARMLGDQLFSPAAAAGPVRQPPRGRPGADGLRNTGVTRRRGMPGRTGGVG